MRLSSSGWRRFDAMTNHSKHGLTRFLLSSLSQSKLPSSLTSFLSLKFSSSLSSSSLSPSPSPSSSSSSLSPFTRQPSLGHYFSLIWILCFLACVFVPSLALVDGAVAYSHQSNINEHDDLSTSKAVERYLENGGYEEYRKTFNLPPGVYYNPLRFFSRVDATNSDGSPSRKRRTSDLSLLRRSGLLVPSKDNSPHLTSLHRQASPCTRQTTVVGSGNVNGKSQFYLYFSPGTSEEAKRVMKADAQEWAQYFSSSIPLRLCFVWSDLDDKDVLGYASTLSFIEGSSYSKLRNNVLYTPALASALQGEDVLSDTNDHHLLININSAVNWHYAKDSLAPPDRYDLATVVLHEMTHGLFFTGTIRMLGPEEADFNQRMPSRFDQFMQVESNISVSLSCIDEEHHSDLFDAVRSPNLRFVSNQIDIGLYAPREFSRGSSIYHFNNETIAVDCQRAGISEDECSDLMTHELNLGYTNRHLGTTTLSVYNALISNSAGVPKGAPCDVPTYSAQGSPGPSNPNDDTFRLPTWGIATVATIGTVGALLVVAVVVSTISARA